MTTLHRRFGRLPVAALAAAAVLVLGLTAGALHFTSAARADSSTCAEATTSAPTGPATVSTETKAPFGKVLVIGSGQYDGCSLYLLTSDQLHSLTGSQYACSDGFNPLSAPCDSVLWPALLTEGAPIAGPGVKAKLLGTVTRTDLPGLPAVQQVTYAGQPLYRFFLDESSDETEGANLFDPVTSPTGIWYLVDPSRGNPATGTAQLQLETAPVGGTGPNATVLSVTMNQDFSVFPNVSFPVYTLSPGHGRGHSHGRRGHCGALCAQYWPPVLTAGRPEAGGGVDQHALGTTMRPDGSRQVTYKGRPLYLFADDAYIFNPGLPAPYNTESASINGAGARTLWGMFNTIPPVH
jgi:predicted lipoprotein with Yx(FWY)xxD motif